MSKEVEKILAGKNIRKVIESATRVNESENVSEILDFIAGVIEKAIDEKSLDEYVDISDFSVTKDGNGLKIEYHVEDNHGEYSIDKEAEFSVEDLSDVLDEIKEGWEEEYPNLSLDTLKEVYDGDEEFADDLRHEISVYFSVNDL